MSIVIAAGNSEKIWIGSDGRRSDVDEQGNHIILDEDFPKLYWIGAQTVIGITGVVDECMRTVMHCQRMANTVPLSTAADLVATNCEAFVKSNYDNPDANIQLIIAGVTCSGNLAIYTIQQYKGNFTREAIYPSSSHTLHFTAVSSLKPADRQFAKQIMSRSLDAENNMRDCIAEAAKRSEYINDKVSMQTIERPIFASSNLIR